MNANSSNQLRFSVENESGIPADQVFIGFWGNTLDAKINGSAMSPGQWYALSSITSAEIDVGTSGRLYVTYQEPGVTPTFSPQDAAPSSATDRFDKFELTFDGTMYGVANLTAIDFWSIPMSLRTQRGGSTVGELRGVRGGTTAQDIYKSLFALSNPAQSGATAELIIKAFKDAKVPLADAVAKQLTNPAPARVSTPGGGLARLIGPNSYSAFGDPAAKPEPKPPGLPFIPYDTFLEYFQFLIDTFGPGKAPPSPFKQLGNGKIAHIQGRFAGSKAGTGPIYAAQSYDLWAQIGADLSLTLDGKGSEVGKISMQVTQQDVLNPAGTYGANPSFSLNGGAKQSPHNDIYGWLLGDLFAGLNIGALGSSVSVAGNLVGEMPSSDWFSKLKSSGMIFEKLWPGGGVKNRWNQWAAALNSVSDAYNFSYAERFSAPQLSIDPERVDALVLILLPASVAV